MHSGLVRACNGVFESSGNGQTAGHYDHNEDLIFTVCVPGATYIDWNFTRFCTEQDFDYLVIFSGRDTLGTRLGVFSGLQGPGSFVVQDSCVTFYFHSDQSVSCTGWEALWSSEIAYFPPPGIAAIPNPNCEDTELVIELDRKVPCDSVYATSFSILGPESNQVQSVTALDCDSLASRFRLTLASPILLSGNYRLLMQIRLPDLCDSIWLLASQQDFQVVNCPIKVDFGTRDSLVCLGSCIQLNPLVEGGEPNQYVYSWQPNALQGAPPLEVCIFSDTFFVLQVSDGVSVPGVDTIFFSVKHLPVPAPDTTVCLNQAPFTLVSPDGGGLWQGPGIRNPAGLFAASDAGAGNHKVLYFKEGCADTTHIEVLLFGVGPQQASCPKAAPFMMSGFAPQGGTWSGMFVDSLGLFSPDSSGRFRVTYTTDQCEGSKWVYVDSLQVPPYDTLCINEGIQTLSFWPPGGLWTGTGMVNRRLGRFNPQLTGPGMHSLSYAIQGCSDTMQVFVVDIDAGPAQVVCPHGGYTPLKPPPVPHGTWSGNRLVWEDPDSLHIDPAGLNHGQRDTLYYNIGKCVELREISAVTTQILQDSITVCPFTQNLVLAPPNLLFGPTGGSWSGEGVTETQFVSDPFIPGDYTLYYQANGCVDSVVLHLPEPIDLQPDTVLCMGNYEALLRVDALGGRWSGPGIISPNNGLLNPAIAGVGSHEIRYSSNKGCISFTEIEVTPPIPVSILTTKQHFCYQDSLFMLSAEPDTGVFSGLGVMQSFFNPSLAGPNPGMIYYEVGEGNCMYRDSMEVFVKPPLLVSLKADLDTVCPFEAVELSAIASGGDSMQHFYRWSQGQSGSWVDAIFVFPSQPTTYFVELSDGCSDPAWDTLLLWVHALPDFWISLPEPACAGEEVEVKLGSDISPVQYRWPDLGGRIADSLFLQAGSTYRFEAQDPLTGCKKDSSLDLLAFPDVLARFSVTLPPGCISPLISELPVLDMSVGGVQGRWMWDRRFFDDYTPGIVPRFPVQTQTDSVRIGLVIEGDGGCTDSMFSSFCVQDTVYLFVPNAFSPNSDGINEHFKAEVSAVRSFHLSVFNRWGEKLFETHDPNQSWDGSYAGKPCPAGMYMYKVSATGLGTFKITDSGTLYLLR